MDNKQPLPPDVEYVAPGLTRQWLCDRKIILFIFKDVSHETVDACANGIIETIEKWPPEIPYLCAYNLCFPEASLTPYFRDRLKEVMERYRDRAGRTAIVIQRTFITNLAQFFLNTQKPGIRVRRIFFSLDEGVAWLKEALPQ
jgi:hypothetical protein